MIDLYEMEVKLEAAGFVVKVGFDHPFASMSRLVCHGVTVREDGNVWGDGSFFNWQVLDIIRSFVAPPPDQGELRERVAVAIGGVVWSEMWSGSSYDVADAVLAEIAGEARTVSHAIAVLRERIAKERLLTMPENDWDNGFLDGMASALDEIEAVIPK